MTAPQDIDTLCINTIRTLSIDAVQAANSGHPGTPMALAPLVYTLWNRVMRFDPKDPIWPNRDRFVLSNGHASMLLWSVLHLTGTQAVNAEYETVGKPAVTLDDIRRFRQFGSKAPGHPEYHLVSGVEATTGPLGQGIAMSVGMAIGERWLAANYNRPGFDVFDYDIYAVCGDGCLMEGVGSEAASLAGHLGLDNLCWIYDNNHITIEGSTQIAFTEDVAARFQGYGWNVLRVGDANDIESHRRRRRRLSQDPRPADVHHPRQPYRLWFAQPPGHGGRAWRAAGRRRGSPHQACVRLAGGCAIPGAQRRARTFFSRRRRARRGGAHGMERALRELSCAVSTIGDGGGTDAATRVAGRVGQPSCRCSPPMPRVLPAATRPVRC